MARYAAAGATIVAGTDAGVTDTGFDVLHDELDSYRELASSTLDVYLTQVNNNLSVIMKRLTGVTVILAGIGAVAGIFGMSEAGAALAGNEQAGFWAVTAMTIALAVGAAYVLRRIGWI